VAEEFLVCKSAFGFGQLFFDLYDLSGDDEEYLTPNSMTKITPGRSNHIAHLLAALRQYLNSPSDPPHTGGKLNHIIMITTSVPWR
jgi:hypothetical protein